jgi:hypothetical protein
MSIIYGMVTKISKKLSNWVIALHLPSSRPLIFSQYQIASSHQISTILIWDFKKMLIDIWSLKIQCGLLKIKENALCRRDHLLWWKKIKKKQDDIDDIGRYQKPHETYTGVLTVFPSEISALWYQWSEKSLVPLLYPKVVVRITWRVNDGCWNWVSVGG